MPTGTAGRTRNRLCSSRGLLRHGGSSRVGVARGVERLICTTVGVCILFPVCPPRKLDTWHFPISPANKPSSAPRWSPSPATGSTSTSPTGTAVPANKPSARSPRWCSTRWPAPTPSSTSPPTPCAAPRSTVATSTSPATTNPPESRCRGWPTAMSSWSTRTAATPTPARVCIASSTRSTTRSTCTRNSKPPTPSGCSPASTSPTSRRPSTCG